VRAILTWHSIDSSGSPISVSPEEFRSQLDWLARDAVRVVPLSELLALPPEADAVTLTFDDGFANVATEAVPALEERGWAACLFVVTAQVGGRAEWPGGQLVPGLPLLDWESLGLLMSRGFEVGSHSRRHPRLPACVDPVLENELAGSAEEISGRLGRRPEAFAYPYGAFDARSSAAVAAAYRWGCTTELRRLGPADSAARLPRIDAWYLRGRALERRWGSSSLRRWLRWRRALRAIRRAAV